MRAVVAERTGVYYTPRPVLEAHLRLMRRIDELHLHHPYFGARRLAKYLRREGFDVGRVHVGTLMQLMGIEALYRKPRTSIPARHSLIYPYLLAGLKIDQPNQAWSSDITYIPMAYGFLYLVAILDVASRKVLAFRLSNTLTADFCVEALKEALRKFGTPGIFNTDQQTQSFCRLRRQAALRRDRCKEIAFEAARHTFSGKVAHRFGFVVWQVHENPNAVFVDFVRTGS